MIQNDIMIVDDNPANLKLLEDMLLEQGQEVRSFPLGRLALAAAMKNPPALILLDINMPEMNGYQVCERLKSIRELSGIPVIFLSALNEIEDKVKAFQAGGVDYISKPFQFEEVHVRVETHLKLHNLQRALKSQNERLEDLVAARTRDLAEANTRLTILDRSKSDFLNLISHEFRTPLNGIFGISDLVFEGIPSTEENKEFRDLFDQSRRRILSILDDALLLSEIDVAGGNFRLEPVSLQSALSNALERAIDFAAARRVTLAPPPPDLGMVQGEDDLLTRALHALLETAVKFCREGETVALSTDTGSHSPGIVIEGTGRSIPDQALPKFFDLFSVSEASTPGGNLGLGPPVASRIISLFGGSVSVTNRVPPGIRLTVSLKGAVGPKADSR